MVTAPFEWGKVSKQCHVSFSFCDLLSNQVLRNRVAKGAAMTSVNVALGGGIFVGSYELAKDLLGMRDNDG